MKRAVSLCCAALGAAAPAVASAQSDWSVHGLIATLSGWTDNLALAPADDDPATPEPVSDFFFNLRPGLLVSRATPRTIFDLSYEFQADLNVDHSEANDYSHRLQWRGFVRPGPRSTVVASVAAAMGDTGALVIATDPTQPDTDFLPPADQTFIRLEATEALRYDLSETWRLGQTAAANRAETRQDDALATRSHDAELAVTADRVWPRQTLGARAAGRFIQLESPGVFDGASRQVETTVEATFQRDFDEHWSGQAFAGASWLAPLDERAAAGVFPVARIGAFYRHDIGFGSALLAREVVPVLFAAQTAVTESASLNLGKPLPWLADDPSEPVLFLAARGALGRTRVVAGDGDDTGWTTALVDGGVFYTNRDPRLSIGLRYSFQHRSSDAVGVGDYRSHTVMLTVAAMVPARPAGVVPIRGSVRVDESDVPPPTDVAEAGAAGGDAPAQ
ncbi:MAG: hypothetical protein D6689_13110 [Deltaproteobacteria bacterium]|nr:MAG: hypothetical protein D6689_13110 [Deltaproteobacteria bacterium]